MGTRPLDRQARSIAYLALPVWLGLTFTTTAWAADRSREVWSEVSAEPTQIGAPRPEPSAYRSLSLDLGALGTLVAPARHGAAAVTLALPQPDGSFAEFILTDSHTMPDALEDKYPEIVSLTGNDAAGRSARVDVSPLGFQAMVFAEDGVVVIRPEIFGSGNRYMSFRREDLAIPGQPFQCSNSSGGLDPSGRGLFHAPEPMTTTGTTERVFRAAVAANHQYVAAVGGGTVAGGLAAVVTAINRVNQIYETELGVHLTLVANNDAIIHASAATDPYSNDDGALDQNQAQLDNVIGPTNYDIGHVFTTGSGGVAGLRVTCINGQKALGTTGLPNPTGDAFYVDYVAHEIGHQFGGDHTFNSVTGSCGGGNRLGAAAYETGSGSTIMAYAGICGADDLQSHSDPYFHAKSLEEINTWIAGTGGACAAATPNPDAVPVINNAALPDGYSIPMRTPFRLTGSATDADGDPLTYNWEQYDLGPATTLAQADTGSGPIFRSFGATSSGTRTFPRMSTVLTGTLAVGEAWPATNRDLTFRLTVRDNHGVPGSPQFGTTQTADDVHLHVTTSAGPFSVTRPNTALVWGRGEQHAVTWNVARTDLAPVSCSRVAIDLSTNGGTTFAYPLAASAPNTGSSMILVPAVPDSAQARVRIACAENVFFDVSDANFTIAAVGDPDPPSKDHIFEDGFDEGDGSDCSPLQLFQDPSFEATDPATFENPQWLGFDSIAGTPFCDSSCDGGQTGAHTGNWFVWFGGWDEASTASLSQTVVFPNGQPRWLNYWIDNQISGDPTASLKLKIDGADVHAAPSSGGTGDYALESIAIPSAYLDGQSHDVRFDWSADAPNGDIGGAIVDDVTLDCAAGRPSATNRQPNAVPSRRKIR